MKKLGQYVQEIHFKDRCDQVEKYLLYSLRTKSIRVVSKKLWDHFKNSNFRSAAPETISTLSKNFFIVDSDLEERNIVQQELLNIGVRNYSHHFSKLEMLQFAQNPMSAVYIVLIVAAQWSVAAFFGLNQDYSIWYLIAAAYFFGAFCNHALYVQIHECCHALIFKTKVLNRVMGLICDFAMVFPGAMAFSKFHLIHHRHLGEADYDPDLVSKAEGEMVGNSTWKKALWLTLFSISQALRPMRLKDYKLYDHWVFLNIVLQIIVNVGLFMLFGYKAILYLFLSTFFALGPHPLGGRWIQEHYLTKEDQETYSYYGPINKVGFNIGYHNEHHDFMNVPWNLLPALKKTAPEYYNNLNSYNSLFWVFCNFIFNKKMSPYSRIVHPNSRPVKEINQIHSEAYSH